MEPIEWVIIGGRLLLYAAGAAGIYKAADNITGKPAEAIKENIIPLALIGAGTYLTLRALKKAGKA